MESNMFYLLQRQKLIRDTDKFLKLIRPELISKFGEVEASKIHTKVLKEYENLIPQFPYIGGKKNKLTSNLVKACWGCDCCNFRIKKNGTPQKAWPPKFVERNCGSEKHM